MIKLKSLIKENPDTLYYKKKTYNYRTEANRCAFLVYKDIKTNKNSLFGYSAVKKEFLSEDPAILNEINELDTGETLQYSDSSDVNRKRWAQKAIKELKHPIQNTGGGHLALENILSGLGRWDGEEFLLKGRIFEVDDNPTATPSNLDIKIESTIPSGKAIIVSFWSYDLMKLMSFKKQYEYAIKFNGYNPKEVLYEPGSKFYTYNELYGIDEPNKEPEKSTSPTSQTDGGEATKYFTIGDKVKLKGMKIFGDVLFIDGNNVTISITDTDMPTIAPIDSEKTFSYAFLEPDNKPARISLEKVIDDKTQEFVEKRGKLHSAGAALTIADKENLEREVDSLEIELKILNDLLTSGEKYYSDNVKSVADTSVKRKLHAKEKEKLDKYSLAAQAEKQYGMPIAQIRQKFRGIPLDQLIKKESLYKKYIKSMLLI